MNTKIIKLDLNKSRLYEKIKAKQGDTESRFLLFQLFDGALPFSLKNRSVRAYMIKPDSKEVFNDLIINDRIKGYCTLELTNQVLAAPGTVKIELMITEGTKKLTSSVFELEVDKSINSEKSIVSTNEFTALLNGLASLSEYDNYKNELKDARDGEVNVGTNIRKIKSQLETITTVATPKMFLFDSDNDKIQKMLDFVRDNSNINEIKLESDKVYNINKGLTFTGNYLKIDGNGSTFNLTSDNITVLSAMCECVTIENLIIDGSNTTQDKFDVTDYDLLNRIEGIFLKAKNITLKNVTIKNFYGSAFVNIGCKNFIAENINISNVGGHWFENNTYDAFGDGFYFRELDKEAKIIMNNVDVIMKNKDNTQSRAGIVLERNNNDTTTNVTSLILSNINFINCDRCIHVENQAREVNIDITNGKFYGNVFGIGWNSSSINYTVRDSNFTLAGGSYGSTIGFSKLKLIADNCIFNLLDIVNCFLRECNGSIISKSIINNIGKTINLSSNAKYYDTILNIVNNGYLSYNSNVEYNRCVFNSESLITENKAGQKNNEYIDCVINNYIPLIKKATNSSIYVDDSYNINVIDFNNLDVKIYKNNILNYTPRTFKVFPYSKDFDLSIFYKSRDFPNTTTYLSIIPDNFVSQKLSKYLIIFIGHNSNGGLIDFDYSQFYYAVITTDNSNNKTISEIKTYGNIGGTRLLEINDSDKTVKQVGNYANKLQSVIVPYGWKEYLPLSSALEL